MSFLSLSLSLSLLQKIGKSHICRQAAVYMKTNVLFESNLQNEAVQSMIDKDQGTKKDQKESRELYQNCKAGAVHFLSSKN